MSKEDFFLQFDNIFFEKTRLSLMVVIYKETSVSFNRFKKLIGGSDGAIYTHLKKLKDAAYISSQKLIENNAPQTLYTITEKGKRVFKQYLSFLEKTILSGGKNHE